MNQSDNNIPNTKLVNPYKNNLNNNDGQVVEKINTAADNDLMVQIEEC